MGSISVQLFLMGDLSTRHGGNIWALSYLEALRSLRDINFFVVSVAPPYARAGNCAIIGSFGYEHAFIPFKENELDFKISNKGTCINAFSRMLRDKYYLLLEEFSKSQLHIDQLMVSLVKDRRPDVVLLTYLYNALLVPSIFTMETRPCMVIANNELAFYKKLRKTPRSWPTKSCEAAVDLLARHANWVAEHRLRAFQDRTYERCIGLAALSPTDLPAGLPDHVVTSVIGPILKESDIRWRYTASRRLFYVGNIKHFPNRLAIEWLSRLFAPELFKIDRYVTIDIIGAELADIPPRWRAPNLRFLGTSTEEEVLRQMTTTDLLIAPIENSFGSKLKLAECLSHGTPFLATHGALSGLRFLQSVPQIELHRPCAAARMAMNYLNLPESLEELSRSILTQARAERARLPIAWEHFFKTVATRPISARR
jgi:hypothetical protein